MPPKTRHLFTSESVTEGHPDKMCDQISDAILDRIITDDPEARVACETATTTGLVLVLGEITTTTQLDIPALAFFPYTEPDLKDEHGSEAYNEGNLVCQACRAIKRRAGRRGLHRCRDRAGVLPA